MDTVDLELDRLISRRASQDRRPDPDELEPGYVESVRRFNARVREENRAAWCDFHHSQAERHKRTLEGLVAHHEAEAARLQTSDERRSA
ncbi:MAG: hypothetical protein H0U91_09900 [Rubrobacter sp.]|nr:hypothetical protein [Rubrobacter sp.]